MSLLGTINPSINPEHSVRGTGRQWHEQNNEDGKPPSLSTGETVLEKTEVGDERAIEEEVGRLARQLTRQSTRYSATGEVVNPFLGAEKDPTLDPNSEHFKPKNWMKALFAIQSRDPERYPQRTAGLAFKNLNVHGYGSPTDYQKDVANSILEIGTLFRYLTGTGKQKIRILRDFDGLINTGEMLLVLGRPGRYVEIEDPQDG